MGYIVHMRIFLKLIKFFLETELIIFVFPSFSVMWTTPLGPIHVLRVIFNIYGYFVRELLFHRFKEVILQPR